MVYGGGGRWEGGGDGGGEGNSLISVWSQLLGRNILLLAGLNNIPPFRGDAFCEFFSDNF